MQYPYHNRHRTLSPLLHWHLLPAAVLPQVYDVIETLIFDLVVVQEVVGVELEIAGRSLLSDWMAVVGAGHDLSASLYPKERLVKFDLEGRILLQVSQLVGEVLSKAAGHLYSVVETSPPLYSAATWDSHGRTVRRQTVPQG